MVNFVKRPRTSWVRFGDTRTANLVGVSDVFTHKLQHRISYISIPSGEIYCETDIKRGLRPQSDGTQCVPCDPENTRVLNEHKPPERQGKYGTHVSTATATRRKRP